MSLGTLIDITLALDAGNAYADGDVLSDTATIADAVARPGDAIILESLCLIDEDDQGVALDIYFFGASQSLGTKNAAASISDAGADDFQGRVNIATTDYSDLGGVRVASKSSLDLLLKPASTSRSLFLGTITRGGTPTYTASGLKLRLGLRRLGEP